VAPGDCWPTRLRRLTPASRRRKSLSTTARAVSTGKRQRYVSPPNMIRQTIAALMLLFLLSSPAAQRRAVQSGRAVCRQDRSLWYRGNQPRQAAVLLLQVRHGQGPERAGHIQDCRFGAGGARSGEKPQISPVRGQRNRVDAQKRQDGSRQLGGAGPRAYDNPGLDHRGNGRGRQKSNKQGIHRLRGEQSHRKGREAPAGWGQGRDGYLQIPRRPENRRFPPAQVRRGIRGERGPVCLLRPGPGEMRGKRMRDVLRDPRPVNLLKAVLLLLSRRRP